MIVEETKVGYFQIVLLFLLSVNYVIVSMSHALPVFHNYTPKFYCQSTDGTNRTYGCASPLTFENSSANLRGPSLDNPDNCANGYTWEADGTEKSVVTDWGLICEKSYLMHLGPMIYCIGVSIGACVSGIMADRIGRLPVLAICLYIQGTVAVATYIVQSYPAFLVLRGLQGVFAQGLQNTTYILTLELFPKKFRAIVAMTMEIFWSLGIVLLAGLSYTIPDWRILQLAASVPTAATVLYIWIIPESPRWLLAKGKSTEADISLEKIVKYNACCTGRERRALVAETADSSVNTTPAKPERKSRLIREPLIDDEAREARKTEDVCESTNLLTPPNPVQRKSRRTSLRALTGNPEEKRSSQEPSGPEVRLNEDPASTEEIHGASGSLRSSRHSRLSSNYELTRDIRKSEKNEDIDEVLIVQTSLTEVDVAEQPVTGTNKNDAVPDIEKLQETTANANTRRNRYLTKYMVVMACEWFTASVARNIVNEISPGLSNDRHVNFSIVGGFEAFAYVLTYFLLTRHGRRIPMSLCQFVNGVVCITVGVVAVLTNSTIAWIGPVRILFLLIGRTSIVCTLATAYLFTVEIFPTVIRGSCLGLCAIAGMIGSLISPHILSLKNHTTIAAPLTIAGVLCIISGVVCLILPETKNDPLPDTVMQIGRTLTKNKIGVAEVRENDKGTTENGASNSEILREKLFSEDWVDAGNGIIVNFSETKN